MSQIESKISLEAFAFEVRTSATEKSDKVGSRCRSFSLSQRCASPSWLESVPSGASATTSIPTRPRRIHLEIVIGFMTCEASCKTIKERYAKIDCQWGRGCRTDGPRTSEQNVCKRKGSN